MAKKATQVTTGEVRLSYAHLLTPYAATPEAKPKYSATLLIPKADIQTKQLIDAAIAAAKQEGLSGKFGGAVPPSLPIPIHDGDGVRPSNGEPFGAECKGCWVLTANSVRQPGIVDLNLQPIINSTEIYSGMYCRAAINFFPYFSGGKKGVGCGLEHVQKLRDGDPLGGGVSVDEAFGAQPAVQPMPQYNATVNQPVYAAPQYTAPVSQQPYTAPAVASPAQAQDILGQYGGPVF